MNEHELNVISTCVMALANLPNGTEQVQNLLKNFISPTAQQNATVNKHTPSKNTTRRRRGRPALENNTFKLSAKEILYMPNKIQKLFAYDDKLIPYRFHKGVFETHYRRNGLNIYASAKDFQEMKRRFIQKLSLAQPIKREEHIQQPVSILENSKINNIMFADYVNQWLATKKVTVKASTYAEYERLCEKNLKIAFANMSIAEMTRAVIQEYLFRFINEGKARTAQKLHLILTCILDLAVEDLNIKNPMNKIELPYHESKKGSAFTKQEERTLVEYCKKNQSSASASALLILLYFGLRQSELASISIDSETLTCTTSKQLKGRVEVQRHIPYTPMAKKVLPYIDFEKAKDTKQRTIASTLKRLFPNHHPHELRYTFITRCKECGVNPEVVMLWDGHSFDKDVRTTEVDRGYTDYSEEYLKKEALKVEYEI